MKMKGNKRIFSKRNIIVLSIILPIILLTILTVGILFVQLYPIVYFGIISPFQENRMQERLLCKTDHQALLEACRALSKQVLAENPVRPGYMKVPDSELSRYPLIRDLGGRVFININGVVSIEMGGTMRHFGVKAYLPEDLNQPSSNYGDKEMFPGLWYYDDRYNREKDYDKVVEKLLQKRK